jgi:hypothetical protein
MQDIAIMSGLTGILAIRKGQGTKRILFDIYKENDVRTDKRSSGLRRRLVFPTTVEERPA